MKAIIYARQSLDVTGQELGITRQIEECTTFCHRRSYTVVDIITDNSISASRGVRPGFVELLKNIESRQCEVVVVLRIDRLLRRLSDLETLIELSERTGVQIATVEGDIDLQSPSGRLIGRILASVARSEVEVKSARQKLANKQKAKAGLPHGGRRPFGYTSNYEIIEAEAKVMRQMAKRIIQGQSYKETAYWANEAGHRTSTGKLFYPITIRNLLKKKLYAGLREYNGEVFTGQWQPIFDADTFDALQATLKTRARKDGRPQARKYLLTGLLYCGQCGLPLNGQQKRDRADSPMRRSYICRVQGDAQRNRGCGGVRRGAEPLEHFIKELVVKRLDTPDLGQYFQTDNVTEMLREKSELVMRSSAAVEDYAQGYLTHEQMIMAKRLIDAQIDALTKKIATATSKSIGVSLVGQTVAEAWEHNSDTWRRQLLAVMIDRITVNAGTAKPFYYVGNKRFRFAPELIKIHWLV